MPLPRLLLVTDALPNQRHAGSVWLESLCDLLPADRFRLCLLGSPPTDDDRWAGPSHSWIPKFEENGAPWLPSRLRRLTRGPHASLQRIRHTKRIVGEIAACYRREACDAVLITLTGPTCLAAAARLGDAWDGPIYTLVWDPPDYYLDNAFQLRKGQRAPFLALFDKVMRRSAGCIVMSRAMQEAYASRYDIRSVVMHHGVPQGWWQKPQHPRVAADEELTIAYAGSLYAHAEWNALLEALDGVKWRIGAHDVRVRLIGGRFERMDASVPRRVEFLGWHNAEQTLREVAASHAAYLPYWLDARKRIATQLCFPTKLSTYAAAGCPVFFHGPADSAAAQFVRHFDLGVCCDTYESSAIIAALSRLILPDVREVAQAGARRAMRQELGLDVFRRRFADLIRVDARELAPVS